MNFEPMQEWELLRVWDSAAIEKVDKHVVKTGTNSEAGLDAEAAAVLLCLYCKRPCTYTQSISLDIHSSGVIYECLRIMYMRYAR